MNKRLQIFKNIFFDFIGVVIAWILFIYYRNRFTGGIDLSPFLNSEIPSKFYFGLFLFVIFWFLLFSLAGFYNDVFRKSRIKELGNSIGITLLGSLFIFFIILYYDSGLPPAHYFKLLYILFLLILHLAE